MSLRILLGAVWIEIAALVVAGCLVGYELVSGRSDAVGVSVFLVVFAIGVAVVLGASARGLMRGQRWARSPVATWQILQAVVAVSSLQVAFSLWIVVALVLAAVVFVLLLTKPVVDATT